jgi:hypothetical protein
MRRVRLVPHVAVRSLGWKDHAIYDHTRQSTRQTGSPDQYCGFIWQLFEPARIVYVCVSPLGLAYPGPHAQLLVPITGLNTDSRIAPHRRRAPSPPATNHAARLQNHVAVRPLKRPKRHATRRTLLVEMPQSSDGLVLTPPRFCSSKAWYSAPANLEMRRKSLDAHSIFARLSVCTGRSELSRRMWCRGTCRMPPE